MKRMIALLSILVLLAALMAGCGGTKEDVVPVQKPGGTVIKPGAAGNAPASGNQSSFDESVDCYTVYVKSAGDWGHPYLWAWSESIGDLYEAFPGEPMSLGADGWYTMRIPVAYDYVIIAGGSVTGDLQTWDLCTNGADIWFTFYEDNTYAVDYSDPAGGTSVPAATESDTEYDKLFRDYGVTDVTFLSPGLSSISAAKAVDGSYIEKQEFGIQNGIVKEAVFIMQYFLNDMTAEQKTAMDKNIRETFGPSFEGYDFVELVYDMTDNVYTFALAIRNLDNANNVSVMIDFMGISSNGLNPDGTMPAPTAGEMESQGYYVKVN